MPAKRTRVDRVCTHCETSFWTTPSEIKKGGGRFCSWDCRVDFKRNEALACLREPLAQRLPSGCLIASGWKNEKGYGRLLGGKSGRKPAHVLSWEMANGINLPDGMIVCHNCPGGDNPSCVEPTHLWAGTHDENMADAATKGQMPHGERNTNAKLTAQIVTDMRTRYHGGRITLQALADEYGVNKTTVSQVIRGTTWRHITS